MCWFYSCPFPIWNEQVGYSQANCISSRVTLMAEKLIFHGIKIQADFEPSLPLGFGKSQEGGRESGGLIVGAFLLFNRALLSFQ